MGYPDDIFALSAFRLWADPGGARRAVPHLYIHLSVHTLLVRDQRYGIRPGRYVHPARNTGRQARIESKDSA